jgi:hypothetical protein
MKSLLIAGQWWNVRAAASVMGASALGFVAERGIGALAVPGDVGWRWESTLKKVVGEQPIFHRDWFNPKFIAGPGKNPHASVYAEISAIVVISVAGGEFVISIRHWFVVTIFTTFNIFLHWFYRKRPEVQPCES